MVVEQMRDGRSVAGLARELERRFPPLAGQVVKAGLVPAV